MSSKALDAEASTSSDSEDSPFLEMATSVGDTLPYRFTCALATYHGFCAALVIIALRMDGWCLLEVRASHGNCGQFGSMLVCGCSFVSLSCVAKGLMQTASKEKRWSRFLLYTMPGCSELADTMKDWILCGICVVAAPTAEGFLYGFIYVAMDLLLRLCPAPRMFPFAITRDFSVWSPAVAMLMLTFPGPGPVLLLLCIWCLFGGNFIDLIMCLCRDFQIWCFLPLGLWLILKHCSLDFTDGFDFSDVEGLSVPFLTPWFDDGFLFIASFYVMIISNVVVMSHPGCAQELRRTYRCVLAIPMTKPEQPQKDWVDWLSLELSLVAADLLSSGRLLFAWAEDLPQGIIGFVLTDICFSQPERGLGFAALSAMVSLAKGCLIPAGQGCLAARLRYVLRQKLDVRNLDLSSTELLGLPRDELRASLPPILEKHRGLCYC